MSFVTVPLIISVMLAYVLNFILGLSANIVGSWVWRPLNRLLLWDDKLLHKAGLINRYPIRLALLLFGILMPFWVLMPLPAYIAWLYFPYLIVASIFWWNYTGKGTEKVVTVEPYTPGEKAFVFETTTGPIYIDNPRRGVFISGGAGSGKSKSVIEPIIQQAGENSYTGIVYDYKFPTLAEEVAGSYAKSDIKTYYVNFVDLSCSHRINPVAPDLITDNTYAREAATTILTNLDFKAAQNRSFWIQSAEVLLTGAIWYLRKNYPQYCTLPHAVSLLLESDPKTLINTLQQDAEVKGIIASVAAGSESQNQLAGVFASIQNYMSTLNSPSLFWVLSADEVPFDLNDPKNPSILTVGNEPTLTATLSPVISLIVATGLKRMNQKNRQQSVVILDEAPTLFIPNFQQIPATGRSNGIATVYAVQDIAQIEGMLGQANSEMIISNLGTQFYGRTTNPRTAQRVTALFGKYDVEYESYGYNYSEGNNSSSENYSVQQRDRLESQEVLRFCVGEFAGLIAEGSKTEFRRQFIQPSSKAQPIKPITTVDDEKVQENFKQIKDQIRQLLAPGPKRNPKKPDADDAGQDWEHYS